MRAHQILESQWVARLRDILTGKYYGHFRICPMMKKLFAKAREKLLAS